MSNPKPRYNRTLPARFSGLELDDEDLPGMGKYHWWKRFPVQEKTSHGHTKTEAANWHTKQFAVF